LRGKGLLSLAKRYEHRLFMMISIYICDLRIPWGGSQSSEYLMKLLQLKYPNFPTRITTTQTNVSHLSFAFEACMSLLSSGCSTISVKFRPIFLDFYVAFVTPCN
jgi:hypothetical protein